MRTRIHVTSLIALLGTASVLPLFSPATADEPPGAAMQSADTPLGKPFIADAEPPAEHAVASIEPVAIGGALLGEGDDAVPLAAILDANSRRISFQALLTDNEGDPLPGPTVNLDFQFYTSADVAVGGVINVPNVPIENGVVDTLIPVDPSNFDGTARKLGVTVNGGAELSPRIELGAVPYAYRVDRVASEELDDDLILGDAATHTAGSLTVMDDDGTTSAVINGTSGQFAGEFGFDAVSDIGGTVVGRLGAFAWGGWLQTWDENGSTTMRVGSSSGDGGFAEFYRAAGGTSVFIDGDDGTGGGIVDVRNSAQTSTITLDGQAHQISTYGDDGLEQTRLWGPSWGELLLFDADAANHRTVRLASRNIIDSGGELQLYRNDAAELGWYLSGGTAGGIGFVYNTAGDETVEFDGEDGQGAGRVRLFDSAGVETARIGSESAGGGVLTMNNGANQQTFELDADEGDRSIMRMSNASGVRTISFDSAEVAGQSSAIKLYDVTGTNVVIELDADFNGEGRGIFDVVQITGGADLSEQFDISTDGARLEPGMVVSIDPSKAGDLVISRKAYDRTVAGIVSGAGGVKPGMLMGQRESEANGAYPVALTGRVYCFADTSNGPIQPGDLLTTSNTPGHAMKVTDHAQAQGAILGKAMTALDEGQGLVLVLVSLQ